MLHSVYFRAARIDSRFSSVKCNRCVSIGPMKNRKLLIPVRCTTRKFYLHSPPSGRNDWQCDLRHPQSMESAELCFGLPEPPPHRPSRRRSSFRCGAIRSPLVRRAKRSQQRNRLCAIYFALLVWDSVRARHSAIAETAVRPSQGRRSKNVITMVALS